MTHRFSASEQLTYCTTRIECTQGDGRISIGTGFFFKFFETAETHLPAVVTDKHVVDASGTPIRSEWFDVILDNFERRWVSHPDENVDLCILPTAPLF